jgi:glycosyltransferase involved in cell wall biosynthesis
MVPPSDATALADALLEVFQNPAKRAKIGAAASAKARKFDWSAVAAQHVALFSKLIVEKHESQPSPARPVQAV